MGHLRPRGAVDFSVLSRFALDIVGVPHLDSYGITSSRGPCIPNPGTARSNERPRWMTGRARPSSRVRGTFLNPEERGGGELGLLGATGGASSGKQRYRFRYGRKQGGRGATSVALLVRAILGGTQLRTLRLYKKCRRHEHEIHLSDTHRLWGQL